jgi:nucleolar GTP-binding protein
MTSLYIFKSLANVHTATELVDIVLSKTQRKTPTEVHPAYQLPRIRAFYMRKVKFSAETFKEKLGLILDHFPKLDDIHPFFADLLNILYDKDHYKIALGQVNVVKSVIDKIAKDYVKLLKYGDSMYRCKTLKIAALGRMCTAVKKLKPSLEYLEEVRKHLSRLPIIDPFLPSILLFGYPNVGKSSFMNLVTKADVEVSEMPFSTQNLFVGHTEFKNVKVQFIDSPGVLDRPLEQRNTIEMQSITALAHLKAMVLFLIDISENCGHSIKNQLDLFESLKPLFANKPTSLVMTKTDLVDYEDLDENQKNSIIDFQNRYPEVQFFKLSTNVPELVENLKSFACEKLMEHRAESRKINNQVNNLKSDEDYYYGVRVVKPTKERNTVERKTCIPDSVLAEKKSGVKPERTTLKDIQEEYGGAGVFSFPWNEHFILENEEWKYDIPPEIMDGTNIIDYVDPDIEKKLIELEREQENLIIPDEEMIDEMEMEENEALGQVRNARYINQLTGRLKKNKSTSKNKISVDNLKKKLEEKGKKSDKFEKRAQRKLENQKRLETKKMMNNLNIEDKRTSLKNKKTLRSTWNDKSQATEVRRRKIQKRVLTQGQKGDADRHVYDLKPKHLNSGKRGIGSNERR